MDTLILLVISAAAIGLLAGWQRRIVIGLWAVALFAALLLFNHHVTTPLDLTF